MFSCFCGYKKEKIVSLQKNYVSNLKEQTKSFMNHFNSIRELLNTLNRGNKLIAEMFEKRKSVYRYEYAVELMDNNEDVIKLLLGKNIIVQNGANLELNDQFLNFFEDILEVNEEINISYINEHIQQIKGHF